MAQQTYTTKAGDTLSKVASQYGVSLADISGYASGDPNKIGIGENLTVNTRDIPPANTINATNLNSQPYKVPPPAPVTAYDGLIASSNAAITGLQTDVNTDKADIKSKYTRLGELPTEKTDAYKDEGVYDKRGAYNNAVNSINQKELAYQTRVDKIRNNNPTGALEEGQTIEIDRLTKDWAVEKAALSISAAFLKDDYELAKSIVDDRISAETDGLKNELAGLEYFYSQNYNTLTDEKKKVLEFQIQNIQDEKSSKENALKEIGAIQLAAAENGAPSSVIVGIGKAGDLTQAISAAGSWIDQTIDRKGDGPGSNTVDLAPEDERILTGSGFSRQDIKDLQTYVSKNGVSAALSAKNTDGTPMFTVQQIAAIKKVYSVNDSDFFTKDSINELVTADVAKTWLEEKYADDNSGLEDLARNQGFASWWKTKGAEKNNFLSSDKARQYVIDQYTQKARDAGLLIE